jgi:hypothetical protein
MALLAPVREIARMVVLAIMFVVGRKEGTDGWLAAVYNE